MKYYKITNEKENHRGLQYKTGLVEDTRPFDLSGDSGTGGIYFAREDILAFLSCGPWIREVTIPEDAQVYSEPDEPTAWKTDKVILGERRKITPEVIKELIEEGADVHADDDWALCWATKKHGYLEVVRLLLDHGADVHARDDEPLRWAASYGHLEVIKFLIEQGADAHALNDDALCLASLYGHLEIVKFLLEKGADVHAKGDWAIRCAVCNGHLAVINFLIEQGADIHAVDDWALRWATVRGHTEVVKVLEEAMQGKK